MNTELAFAASHIELLRKATVLIRSTGGDETTVFGSGIFINITINFWEVVVLTRICNHIQCNNTASMNTYKYYHMKLIYELEIYKATNYLLHGK